MMAEEEIRVVITQALSAIAPEVDTEQLDPAKPLRDQVDLDSMDWLNFLLALNAKLKVEIPEADYGKLTTIAAISDYLAARVGRA